MKIEEHLEWATERMRWLKEERVKDTAGMDRNTDLAPVVHGWRGDEPVVTMFPLQVDRDAGLTAVNLAAMGFGCDVIALTTDSWRATGRINPVTGKRWRKEEMQDVALNHDGIAKGWIVESLTVQVVNRAGDSEGTVMPYRITEHTNALGIKRYEIEWLDDVDSTRKGMTVGGLLADAMHNVMVKAPTVDQVMARQGITGESFGLNDVQTRAHVDCAIVKTIAMAGLPMSIALMVDSEERGEIIDRSLADGPFTVERI